MGGSVEFKARLVHIMSSRSTKGYNESRRDLVSTPPHTSPPKNLPPTTTTKKTKTNKKRKPTSRQNKLRAHTIIINNKKTCAGNAAQLVAW